jgi:hypothetical protein
MRVFFFRKDVIVWGIILLAVVVLLMVLLRITNGERETFKQGLAAVFSVV